MSLNEEIKSSRSQIYTDGYAISINELAGMYKEGELDIHPAFQRFFRWQVEQKSKFIESILLGIPIPNIFISQRENGSWDVIDGLQRLSTLFEFMGILRDEDDNLLPPSTLKGTRYLPTLEGKRWEDGKDGIGKEAQLLIKRSKLDVRIVLRESTDASKYELFQRINTGGSFLSDQEIRNCILISTNPGSFEWLEKLSHNEDFKSCTALTDRSLSERYDLELILRFLLLRSKESAEVSRIENLGDWLTDEMVQHIGRSNYAYKKNERIFSDIFSHLNEQLSEDSFKRFSPHKSRFLGGFLISAFEFATIGLGYNYDSYKRLGWPNTRKIVEEVWSDANFLGKIGSGVRTSSRLRDIIPLAREKFSMK